MSDELPSLTQPEPDDEPFRLTNTTRPRSMKSIKKYRGGRPRKFVLSPADMKLLESVVHREDYTRAELAEKFGLTLKQLQRIIREQGWSRSEGMEHDEDCEPFPNPDPSVFIRCPYPPGSEGKLWFLEERFAKRLPLWHPNDRHERTPHQTGNLS